MRCWACEKGRGTHVITYPGCGLWAVLCSPCTEHYLARKVEGAIVRRLKAA